MFAYNNFLPAATRAGCRTSTQQQNKQEPKQTTAERAAERLRAAGRHAGRQIDTLENDTKPITCDTVPNLLLAFYDGQTEWCGGE